MDHLFCLLGLGGDLKLGDASGLTACACAQVASSLARRSTAAVCRAGISQISAFC